MTRSPALMVGAATLSLVVTAACQSRPSDCGPPPSASAAADAIDLSDRLAGGRLRLVNRRVTEPSSGGLRVTEAAGIGLIWIDGTDFAEGTIEADVCGRDVTQESFLGLAVHRQDDETYEAVYLRPFNFRRASSDARQHAIQYVAMPRNGYARLRDNSPGEFEHAVDASVAPAAWNRLRLVVRGGRVQAFVGNTAAATLDVRELQVHRQGQVGLFVDNGSDGVFANLRVIRDR